MEDARFVRFVDDDGAVTYLATYTAFDQSLVAPQLLSTTDFRTFVVSQLSGPFATNKGMALFPRKVGGRHWLCRAGTASAWPSRCPTMVASGPKPPPWTSPRDRGTWSRWAIAARRWKRPRAGLS